MNTASMVHHEPAFDQFDFLHTIERAYKKAFTTPNIKSGFNKTGTFPVEAKKAILSSRSKFFNDITNMCTSRDVTKMLDDKLKKATQEDQLQPLVVCRCQISTKKSFWLQVRTRVTLFFDNMIVTFSLCVKSSFSLVIEVKT